MTQATPEWETRAVAAHRQAEKEERARATEAFAEQVRSLTGQDINATDVTPIKGGAGWQVQVGETTFLQQKDLLYVQRRCVRCRAEDAISQPFIDLETLGAALDGWQPVGRKCANSAVNRVMNR
jgi:hypothetical protein